MNRFEQDFRQHVAEPKRSKAETAAHYTAQVDELKWQQFGKLIAAWNEGRKLSPSYSLESAVERVERDSNTKILPAVMVDIKEWIALTLAQGE